MKPRKKEYEQVKVDEWLTGEIVDIQYEKDREFTYKGVKSIDDAVRIILRIDGCQDKKMTSWFKFNYGEKANLYKLFISSLVEAAHPNMDFDLDLLKNLRIKVMYAQNGEYQNIVMIRPLESKILSSVKLVKAKTNETDEEEVPF